MIINNKYLTNDDDNLSKILNNQFAVNYSTGCFVVPFCRKIINSFATECANNAAYNLACLKNNFTYYKFFNELPTGLKKVTITNPYNDDYIKNAQEWTGIRFNETTPYPAVCDNVSFKIPSGAQVSLSILYVTGGFVNVNLLSAGSTIYKQVDLWVCTQTKNVTLYYNDYAVFITSGWFGVNETILDNNLNTVSSTYKCFFRTSKPCAFQASWGAEWIYGK